MNTMKKLACFGSCCIDDYRKTPVSKRFVGGGPLNSAIHANKGKIGISFLSAVGNDEAGKAVIDTLDRCHLDRSHLRIINGTTAVCEVMMQKSERILGDYDEGVMRDYSLSDEDLRFLKKHDLLLSDYWGKQERHFHYLKEEGCAIAFDAADRVEEVYPFLKDLAILFFSGSGISGLEEKMKQIEKEGPSLVVATLGEKGSIAYDGKCFYRCEAIRCGDLIDTMGAGDAYIGSFLYHFLMGETIEECMKEATVEAAETLTYYGAFPQEGF